MRGVGLIAGAFLMTGCVYGYQSLSSEARYSASRRPESSYYCYDCHGYRYFDPYYDWCTEYGFRYRWQQNPRAVEIYRERYVGLRRENRDFGRYNYPEDYRGRQGYQEPRDYEAWKMEGRKGDRSDRYDRKRKSRDRDWDDPGRKREKRPNGNPPREPGWRLGMNEGVGS